MYGNAKQNYSFIINSIILLLERDKLIGKAKELIF